MAKDVLAIRRNTGLFMSVIAPIFFVLLFAGRLGTKAAGSSFSVYVFPAALAYTLMGIAPLAYNSFGLEGAGAQFYFMAPVSMRDVFLAKNLLNFILAAIEGTVVLVIVTLSTGMPTLQITVATFLWAIATLLLNTSIGNRRSITAPKKVDLGRAAAKQASPLSALISLGILIVCGATGASLLILASLHSVLWTLPPLMGILAAASLIFYRRDLTRLDAFALAHRDELFEELCKK
jgi:ABC-2 type transport system permease protein